MATPMEGVGVYAGRSGAVEVGREDRVEAPAAQHLHYPSPPPDARIHLLLWSWRSTPELAAYISAEPAGSLFRALLVATPLLIWQWAVQFSRAVRGGGGSGGACLSPQNFRLIL